MKIVSSSLYEKETILITHNSQFYRNYNRTKELTTRFELLLMTLRDSHLLIQPVCSSFKGKQHLAQQKTPCVCPAHVKFKAEQGRMCYVMCWGLQHIIAVLHNRKPGTHCPLGLKQQACAVLPPPLPCDIGVGHVTSPGVRSKRGAFTVR